MRANELANSIDRRDLHVFLSPKPRDQLVVVHSATAEFRRCHLLTAHKSFDIREELSLYVHS